MKAFLYRACAIIFSHFVLYPDYRISFFIPLAFRFADYTPEFSLPDTAGVSVSLSDFRGKYVLLDFWASWCPPCRKENPNVVNAFQQYKDKNFTIVGISLDKDKAKWQKAIADDHLTWAHVSDLKYWDSEIPALYGVRGIPANVLLDPNGVIIAKNITGEDLQNTLKEVIK